MRPAEIAFETTPEGMTRLEIATTDRPGLLSQIAESLLTVEIRLHDARIATFGQRVEDSFLVSTRAGQALDDSSRNALEQELRQRLDP